MKILEYVFATLLIVALPTLLAARWLNDKEAAKKHQTRILRAPSTTVFAISIVLALIGGGGLWLLVALHVTK